MVKLDALTYIVPYESCWNRHSECGKEIKLVNNYEKSKDSVKLHGMINAMWELCAWKAGHLHPAAPPAETNWENKDGCNPAMILGRPPATNPPGQPVIPVCWVKPVWTWCAFTATPSVPGKLFGPTNLGLVTLVLVRANSSRICWLPSGSNFTPWKCKFRKVVGLKQISSLVWKVWLGGFMCMSVCVCVCACWCISHVNQTQVNFRGSLRVQLDNLFRAYNSPYQISHLKQSNFQS